MVDSETDKPLLEVNGVWKRLCTRPEKALRYALADIARDVVGRCPPAELRDGEFWALQDVDFRIERGQVVGIIGHNGAGKSTLINLVSGVMLPTLGSITLRTPRVVLIDHGSGLNPIETGRENALTQLALHGVPEEALTEELRAVEAFAEIGDFIDAPVGTYSVGMRLRLAFAIYSRLRPDLFIIDEALGGGDDRFRNKFRVYLRDYIDGGGTMLLCSHEMLAIQTFCDHCLLLDRGRVLLAGAPVDTIAAYHDLGEARVAQQAQLRAERRQEEERASLRRCSIESIAIVTAGGELARPGSQMTIEIAVAVAEVIDRVACGIEIGRGELTSLATLTGGYPNDPLTLLPPVTTLRCRIDRLPLAPGSYEIRASLILSDSSVRLATKGYHEPASRFDVAADSDHVSNLVRARQNVVHIPTAWSTQVDAPGEAVVD